jgi:hypothetical protein
VLNKDIENESKKYTLVIAENLVGLHTVLFARKSIAAKLKEITTSKLKLGFAGQMGNKGANFIRFIYEDTSFCFSNCHLESGYS